MSFTNATFLYALLLAAVPVIIHLFGIKKPVKEVFAPLPVILKIRKKIIRRKRIHSLVLLLLRVLFIVLLVLSFSGLFINYRSSTQKASDGCLFLVDNSPSSAVNTERGPLLKLILTEIEKYIAEKKDSCGKFTVYTLSDGKRFEILSEGVTNDKIENRISTGYRPVSIERELTEILALEREKKYEEIVLFSDMYSHFVNNHDTALQIIRDNNIEVADINIPPASNVFISQLRVEDIGGKGIRLIAVAENAGEAPFYGTINITENGSSLDKITVNLPPSDTTEISFEIPERGDSTGEHFFIINADGDNFKYDNTEYFYYRNSGRGKVLIVNGEPSPDETKNEVFFLSNALKSYFNESLKIYTVLEDMIPETPQLYDIILLANVSILDEYRGRLLSDYVREGGRLLVTLGSRINISAYNRLPFMPADIIRMVDAEKDENIKYFNEGFFSAIPELIQGMKRVKLYRIFEVKERQDSKILIKTSEQRPLLLSGDYGKGFVMLYTTSVDMDMNDFPVRKNYLPFISVVFSKMLDGLSDRRVIYVRGGEEISLKVQDCSNEDMVINGNRHISVKGRCREEPSGGKVLMFNAPFESGFYRLSSDNTSAVLVVNSDKAESVLKRTPFKEMKKGKGIQGGGNSLISKDILKGGKLNLIEFLLALAGIILFSEMFVMNRR